MTPAQAKEIFRKFNSSFDETCRKQSSFVVSDPKLRDEMKVSLARKIVQVIGNSTTLTGLMLSESEMLG
ncbi:exocyst complex component exo70h1 [Quercus suber]|uniref:Exocyst subunit Exo70 family protein n=1 Tax=Quercus suber TaxID=58331 RepID=A0AAW0LKU3_QUESU